MAKQNEEVWPAQIQREIHGHDSGSRLFCNGQTTGISNLMLMNNIRFLLEQYWWLCLLVSTFRASRVYCLEGVLNYRACQGQRRLYRSASLDTMTIPAAEKVLQSGVSAIIDLRSADEIEKGARDLRDHMFIRVRSRFRPRSCQDERARSAWRRAPTSFFTHRSHPR